MDKQEEARLGNFGSDLNSLGQRMDTEEINRALVGPIPLRKLRPFFKDWETVLQSYAQEISRMFSPNAESGSCNLCERCPAEKILYTWSANYDTKETLFTNALLVPIFLLFGHLAYKCKTLQFTTAQWLCGPCARRQLSREMLTEFATKVSIVAFALSLLIAVFSACFLGCLMSGPSTPAERHRMIEWTVGGLAGCAVSFLGTLTWRRIGFPKKMPGLGKAPFSLLRRQRAEAERAQF